MAGLSDRGAVKQSEEGAITAAVKDKKVDRSTEKVNLTPKQKFQSAAKAVSQAKKMLAFGNAMGGKKDKKAPARVPDSPTEAMDLVTEVCQQFAVSPEKSPARNESPTLEDLQRDVTIARTIRAAGNPDAPPSPSGDDSSSFTPMKRLLSIHGGHLRAEPVDNPGLYPESSDALDDDDEESNDDDKGNPQ